MTPDKTEAPRLKNAAGVLLFIVGLTLYALLVMRLSVWLSPLHWALDLLYYLVFGFAWLWPARRLLRWMAPAAGSDAG